MRRLLLPPMLASLLVVVAACGASTSNAVETLPPIRTTTSTSSTSTTLDLMRRIYVVQPGDNVNDIASAYGVRATSIIELNNLPGNGIIQPGQELMIPNEVLDTELPTPPSSSSPTDEP